MGLHFQPKEIFPLDGYQLLVKLIFKRERTEVVMDFINLD